MDHGSLDFAALLEPVDTAKYEYLSLHDSARWGILLPQSCPLACKAVVEKEDLLDIPLILHRRVGLQQEIAHWAQTEIERLHVAATYNVLVGDPSAVVQSGLGYLLITDDHLPEQLNPLLCFRPLSPSLEIRHALVWKRYAVLSGAAQAFLTRLNTLCQPLSELFI